MSNEDTYLYDRREDWPLATPTRIECCQGCGYTFDPSDVTIVDGVGPVCMYCLTHLAERYFDVIT